MKQSDIIKVLKTETKAQDLEGINKALKSKDFKTKFRLTGPGFVHFGFTGLIKSLTPEGIKIYNTNRVNLVRYEDIETFAKVVPREDRKGTHTPEPEVKAKAKPSLAKQKLKAPVETDEEDYDNDDDFDPYADEDDDVIEDESFAMKLESNKKNNDEDKEDTFQKKKKRLHQKGSGSLFIPKKK